jgi:hypothetical protein
MRHFPHALIASPRAARCAALASLLAGSLLVFGSILTSPAHAGRPMITDDAGIVERGDLQVEAWSEWARGARAAWINVGVNPFGSTEFSIGAAHADGDAGRGTPVAWQIKQLLRPFDDETAGFALALRGEYDPRVHGGGSGLPGAQALLALATWPLAGERLLLDLNLGALRDRAGDNGAYRTRATWAVALDAELLPATRVSMEGFGVGSDRARWQAGLRHQLLDSLQIDFAFGAQAGSWSATRLFSVGLVFAAPLPR